MTPDHDRDYWRCEPNSRLIREALDSGHELTIALGERLHCLSELEDEHTDLQAQREDLEWQCGELRNEMAALRADMDAYDVYIGTLERAISNAGEPDE